MFLFDLHCDTITECLCKNQSLIKNSLYIDIERGVKFEKWIQTFAFWIDDTYRGEPAYQRYLSQREILNRAIENNIGTLCLYKGEKEITPYKCHVILAVEGGHVLGGKLSRIAELKSAGVSYLTLVWNSDNELGSGVLGSGNGLTPFGKEAVTELEKCNIIVDVSHLNELGFDDVCSIAKKPIIATHSNSRVIHDNKRNLLDYQLEYIIKHKGLCGINFYPVFVNGGDDCTYDDLVRHIDHILALGGEDILAIGSDFDGAKMPKILSGIDKMESFYEHLLKIYSSSMVDKIFYHNAKCFVEKNLSGL